MITLTADSLLTGKDIPRAGTSIGNGLMRGSATIPDWLPLLDTLRKADPHMSSAGADGARLAADFKGVRDKLTAHFQNAPTAVPMHETDIREAWKTLRSLGPDTKGQVRFKEFDKILHGAPSSRLMLAVKRGPETVHTQRMSELVVTAGDSANEALRAQREMYFKTCNTHFGEIVGAMTPHELALINDKALETMARDHYLHLTTLGAPTTETIAASRLKIVEALIPEAARRTQILSTLPGSTVVAGVVVETVPQMGKGWTQERKDEASRANKTRAAEKLRQEQELRKRAEEAEAELRRLQGVETGLLGEHPAGVVIEGNGVITTHDMPATLNEVSGRSVTVTEPHLNGLNVTGDPGHLLTAGEILGEHGIHVTAGNGTLAQNGIFIHPEPLATGTSALVMERPLNGHIPLTQNLVQVEALTPLADRSVPYSHVFTVEAGHYPGFAGMPNFTPVDFSDSLLGDVSVLGGNPVEHGLPLSPPPPPIITETAPPPMIEPRPTVTVIEPPPTLVERAAVSSESVVVQGEKLLATESNAMMKQAAHLASEEGMVAKVLGAVKSQPALTATIGAIGALGLYTFFSKSKGETSHRERLQQERNPAHKTEPFKPDADIQMGAAHSSKDIAKSVPATQTSR